MLRYANEKLFTFRYFNCLLFTTLFSAHAADLFLNAISEFRSPDLPPWTWVRTQYFHSLVFSLEFLFE